MSTELLWEAQIEFNELSSEVISLINDGMINNSELLNMAFILIGILFVWNVWLTFKKQEERAEMDL